MKDESSEGQWKRTLKSEVLVDKSLNIERFRKIPFLDLTCLSTPIEKCEKLRKAIPGAPHLYIKRDDHIGYLCGGNKIRKLAYVMADVLEREATAVVTIGCIQSNHARATAMVAKRLGLKCTLVLNGDKPEHPQANFRIDSLLDVDVVTVSSRDERCAKMNEVAKSLEAKGEKVYKVSLGASDPIGSFGFVKAVEELLLQQQEMQLRFDALVIGSSSGGTQAGLEVGKRLFPMSDLRIFGISPDDPAEGIRDTLVRIAAPMFSQLGLVADIDPGKIVVDETFIGRGYGLPTALSEEAAEIFLETEGILLDPVYTSKAAAALIDYCRKGVFSPDENVLFWHTGGLINLFE